eukprot:scaffold2678_cov123-Skeletonema_dohrnii-CCMP3373.AAC.9
MQARVKIVFGYEENGSTKKMRRRRGHVHATNMTMQLYFNPRRIRNANKCDRHTLQEMGTISKVRGISSLHQRYGQ